MGRKRKHGVDLPEHVHVVKSKGKHYYFYQKHRGTERQGDRIALPNPDTESVEFWDAVRKQAGTVAGYTGTVAAMIDAYFASPEFEGLAERSQRIYKLYIGHSRLAIGKHPPDSIRPAHVIALRDQYRDTPGAANILVRALQAVYKWGRVRDYATKTHAAICRCLSSASTSHGQMKS